MLVDIGGVGAVVVLLDSPPLLPSATKTTSFFLCLFRILVSAISTPSSTTNIPRMGSSQRGPAAQLERKPATAEPCISDFQILHAMASKYLTSSLFLFLQSSVVVTLPVLVLVGLPSIDAGLGTVADVVVDDMVF